MNRALSWILKSQVQAASAGTHWEYHSSTISAPSFYGTFQHIPEKSEKGTLHTAPAFQSDTLKDCTDLQTWTLTLPSAPLHATWCHLVEKIWEVFWMISLQKKSMFSAERIRKFQVMPHTRCGPSTLCHHTGHTWCVSSYFVIFNILQWFNVILHRLCFTNLKASVSESNRAWTFWCGYKTFARKKFQKSQSFPQSLSNSQMQVATSTVNACGKHFQRLAFCTIFWFLPKAGLVALTKSILILTSQK